MLEISYRIVNDIFANLVCRAIWWARPATSRASAIATVVSGAGRGIRIQQIVRAAAPGTQYRIRLASS
jgi:hypothetical protein